MGVLQLESSANTSAAKRKHNSKIAMMQVLMQQIENPAAATYYHVSVLVRVQLNFEKTQHEISCGPVAEQRRAKDVAGLQ